MSYTVKLPGEPTVLHEEHVIVAPIPDPADVAWQPTILEMFEKLAESINKSSTVARQVIIGNRVSGISLTASQVVTEALDALFVGQCFGMFLQSVFEEVGTLTATGCPEVYGYVDASGNAAVKNFSNQGGPITSRTLIAHGTMYFPFYNNVFGQGNLLGFKIPSDILGV